MCCLGNVDSEMARQRHTSASVMTTCIQMMSDCQSLHSTLCWAVRTIQSTWLKPWSPTLRRLYRVEPRLSTENGTQQCRLHPILFRDHHPLASRGWLRCDLRFAQEIFNLITHSPHYKLAKIPTDPGYYAFIYFYNGTCISHGGAAANVGKVLQQILATRNLLGEITGPELNSAFVRNAEMGGGWTWYPWKNAPNLAAPLKNKYAYVVRGPGLYADSKYYIGIGFLSGNSLPWSPLPTCIAGAISVCRIPCCAAPMRSAQSRHLLCEHEQGSTPRRSSASHATRGSSPLSLAK